MLSCFWQHAARMAAWIFLWSSTSFAVAVIEYDPVGTTLPPFGITPPWMQINAFDTIAHFDKADPHYSTQGRRLWEVILGRNISLGHHTGYSYGNLGVVRFGMKFIMAVRKSHWSAAIRSKLPWYPAAQPHQDDRIRWWSNAVALCSVDSNTLQPLHCQDYDPRTWAAEECWWGHGFEGQGVEDPRLFVWPSKGLYMLFGSKPWQRRTQQGRPPLGISDSVTFDDLRCDGPLAFQQWLVLVEPLKSPATGIGNADPWMQGVVRLQYTDDGSNVASDGLRREKNWNPFVYKRRLLFSQNLSPHTVIQCGSKGHCRQLFKTDSPVFRSTNSTPRGNTAAVLVPSAFSGEPRNYYLGIAHVEKERTYSSFFYKMQAVPPFRIVALSEPIPLKGAQNPWNPAWKDVAFPMSLDLLMDSNRVVIGYGSGDSITRILTLGWGKVKSLFPGHAASSVASLRRPPTE